MKYFYDNIYEKNGQNFIEKGRLYKKINVKNPSIFYYQFCWSLKCGNDILCDGAISDFGGGEWLDLTEENCSKAIIKKYKV